MQHPTLDLAVFLSEAKMNQPEFYRFQQGCFSIFSTPSPEREGPNQDAVAIIPFDRTNVVIAVADGVGGMSNGELAAFTAIQTLIENINQCSDIRLMRESILSAIEKANQAIIQMTSNLATTLAIVEIRGRKIRSYHIGDPLILLTGQRGKLKFQNITHSPVGYAMEAGLIDEEEAIHHEERNLVSNVMGFPDMRIEIGPVLNLNDRDTLLISSDAIPDNLFIDETSKLIRAGKIEQCASQLIKHAKERMIHPETNQPSHMDDMSFILYRPIC